MTPLAQVFRDNVLLVQSLRWPKSFTTTHCWFNVRWAR